MGRRPHEPLRPLTPGEEESLERLIKAQCARSDQVRRATALQAVAQGLSYVGAAERAGYKDEESVSRLVRRFNQRGLGVLRIAAGRGRTITYGPAERGRVVALAQRTPDREEDGTATWSLSTLDAGADDAAGGPAAPWGDDDPPGAAGGGEFLSTHAYMVPDRHRRAPTQRRSRPRHRPGDGEKKGRIEQA